MLVEDYALSQLLAYSGHDAEICITYANVLALARASKHRSIITDSHRRV